MVLSEEMYKRALPLWEEACEKPFVKAMALGNLDHERFRNYMVQDYLYLLDYLELLEDCVRLTEDPALLSFLGSVIEETKQELLEVHIPNLKTEGIKPEELLPSQKAGAIRDYVDYMKSRLSEEGLPAGLTALLQCCWVYAFIGERVTEKYAAAVAASPYRSWFECYTGEGYNAAKKKWIEVLDQMTAGIDGEKGKALCEIFVSCAGYENRLWDALYDFGPDGGIRNAE
ncbi:MAG: hypothetical protein IJT05_06375 [Lachnospiraceae bacterium]|nr:hypothetical protein [Lachnospiraceae bacterium]